jgi:hypothetical protein
LRRGKHHAEGMQEVLAPLERQEPSYTRDESSHSSLVFIVNSNLKV